LQQTTTTPLPQQTQQQTQLFPVLYAPTGAIGGSMVFADDIAFEVFKFIILEPEEVLGLFVALVIWIIIFGVVIYFPLKKFTSTEHPLRNGYILATILYPLMQFLGVLRGMYPLSQAIVVTIEAIGILIVIGFWIFLRRLPLKKFLIFIPLAVGLVAFLAAFIASTDTLTRIAIIMVIIGLEGITYASLYHYGYTPELERE
jgi:hypothetical protein